MAPLKLLLVGAILTICFSAVFGSPAQVEIKDLNYFQFGDGANNQGGQNRSKWLHSIIIAKCESVYLELLMLSYKPFFIKWLTVVSAPYE